MIIDNSLVLASAQALTASGATTSYVDQLAAGAAMPAGSLVKIQFLINTAVAATGGASTATFSVQDSADGITFVDIVRSADIAKATLVAGYVIELILPAIVRRYFQGYVTMTTNNWTSGKIDCRAILDSDKTLDKLL